MKSEHLLICDPDEAYATALANYLMQRKELALQVQICSHFEHLHEIAEQERIDFLFLAESYPEDWKKQIKSKKTFLLSESRKRKIKTKETVLYKYQSGDGLLNAFLLECGELFSGQAIFSGNPDREQKIIGVFSPVHRIGKSSYAMELGKSLAEENVNVLYLNLEIFGGIGGHFEQANLNLADVLYYARQEKSNLGLLLTTIVKQKDNLDYIAPMISEDIKKVAAEEWIGLIKRILEESIYETIILDLDEGLPGIYSLLEICTQLHVLTLECDFYAQAKLRQFEKELSLFGKEELLKRMQMIDQGGKLC